MRTANSYQLTGSDGYRWGITGIDRLGRCVAARVAEVYRAQSMLWGCHTLIVYNGDATFESDLPDEVGVKTIPEIIAVENVNRFPVGCLMTERRGFSSTSARWIAPIAISPADTLLRLLYRTSTVIGRQAIAQHGFIMHGALAELDGAGVILTGRSGAGKSTASNRIPPPWRSLSDDATLVLRDADGVYRAHPWPTHSRFEEDGPGGTWPVEYSVPLWGIFALEHSLDDTVDVMGNGQACCVIHQASSHFACFITQFLSSEERLTLHRRMFDTTCEMARRIPCFRLRLSLTGDFWTPIERALGLSVVRVRRRRYDDARTVA